MPIKPQSEKQSHLMFLRYQTELEDITATLHKNVESSLNTILARNTGMDGKVPTAKVKLIVDKYMHNEMVKFRTELSQQIKLGVSDSSQLGVRSVVAAVAPHRKIGAKVWTNMSDKIRKRIINLRGVDGLKLSERVWKLANDNEHQLKRIVAGDILQGTSADKISRNIRSFLLKPETARGRMKDLLKVGQGVYKSAYKNAVRVARTETNRAYIDGQKDAADEFDMKLKFQVSGINVCDICTGYNGKIYDPKDFPAPVHPHCMCHGLTVLPEAEAAALATPAPEGSGAVIPKASDLTPAEKRSRYESSLGSAQRDILKRTGNRYESSEQVSQSGVRISQKSGGKSNIKFTRQEVIAMKDNTFIHNHPQSSSLSLADVMISRHGNVAEMRALAPKSAFGSKVYSLKRPAAGWNSISEERLKSVYRAADKRVHRLNTIKISQDYSYMEKANKLHHHEVWTEVSQKIKGFNYSMEDL